VHGQSAAFIARASSCSRSAACSTAASGAASIPSAVATAYALLPGTTGAGRRSIAKVSSGGRRDASPERSAVVLFVGVPCGRNPRPSV
jgi:hypothetical protein